MKEKPRAVRRAELAADIEKRLKSIIADLDKIPSFKGKARFMDKVFRVNTRAHNLAWDLRYDSTESTDSDARIPARKTQSTAKP